MDSAPMDSDGPIFDKGEAEACVENWELGAYFFGGSDDPPAINPTWLANATGFFSKKSTMSNHHLYMIYIYITVDLPN